MFRIITLALAIFLLGVAPLAPPAAAQNCDQACAAELERQGVILPFSTIANAARAQVNGKLLNADLFRSQDGQIWIYQLKLQNDRNQIIVVNLNASTAQILR